MTVVQIKIKGAIIFSNQVDIFPSCADMDQLAIIAQLKGFVFVFPFGTIGLHRHNTWELSISVIDRQDSNLFDLFPGAKRFF